MSRRNRRKYDEKTLSEKKTDFRRHVRTYLVMSVFFVALNLFSSPWSFWAIWPILGWGIGVAMQGLSLYGPLKDPEDVHPTDAERGLPLPDLDEYGKREKLELPELDRRPYRDEDLV